MRIEPARHRLEADVWIRHPPPPPLYLHEGFAVHRIEADGEAVPFRSDAAAAPLPYAERAAAVLVEAEAIRVLRIGYGGTMGTAVAGVTAVAPDLVELASYSAWYPTFAGSTRYEFELEADPPGGFVTTTNGWQTEHRTQGDRSVTAWTSYALGSDIVLLSSPRWRRRDGGTAGARVEIYAHRLPARLLDAKAVDLAAGMERLGALYGPPRVPGVLRLVDAPRAGWCYARMPLVVAAEERARRVLSREHGEARDFRDNAHELAHFWWSIADPGTPDDWINEGLAEYCAFRLTEERFGAAFAGVRFAEYRRKARRRQTSECIAETTTSSPDREVNRYDRATLMLLEAQRRFGREPLDGLLRALHGRFAGTGQATTAGFLEEAERRLGRRAEAFFRVALYRRTR